MTKGRSVDRYRDLDEPSTLVLQFGRAIEPGTG